MEKIRECWASLYTARAISYREANKIPSEGLSISVAVQKMVNSHASGVAMTIDPANGDRTKIVIDSSWGLGEMVVSGEVTPDNFVVDKVMLVVVNRIISDKHEELVPTGRGGIVRREVDAERRNSPSMSEDQIIAVAKLAKAAEKHYGSVQDVEWAIDAEGKGTPKEWQPAVWLGGTNYELRIDSAKLPFGVRLPVLVRATDNVGLSDPPARIWLSVGAEPASKLNSLTGKVMLSGRGEPDLPVVLSGPGGDRTARTRQGGVFRFDDLEPGQYKASVQAAVRNRMCKAEPTAVTIEAAPAAAASVTLELK